MNEYNIKNLDIKETLLSNIIYVLFLILIFYFIINMINIIKNLDETIKLLTLIIFCFTFIKLISMVGKPIIVFKKSTNCKIILR
jgi:hypothetical protein